MWIRKFAREIFVGVVTAIVVGLLVGVWPTIQAYVMPDFTTGDFILLSPGEVKGTPAIAYLSLSSYRGRVWGDEVAYSKDGETHRSLAGYWKSQHLTLAYRSEGPEKIGFGNLIAGQLQGASRVEFVGTATSLYCDEKSLLRKPELLRCPVVLIKGERNSQQQHDAIERYKDYVGTEANCKSADTPQQQSTPSVDLSCPAKRGT